MVWTKFPTFTAGEELLSKRRVKIKSGTTTIPPEVVYSDAGEEYIGITGNGKVDSGDPVSIQPINATGTYECTAAEAFVAGAVLYGADDGKVQDTSNGSAIATAVEASTGDGAQVEIMPFGVKSTTAGTVSIADAGGFTSAATSEAALQEIYQDLLSSQCFIPIPLNTFREASSFDVGNIAANGGLLASDTTPVLEAINGATDGCQRISWAASNSDQIVTSIPLPPDLDVSSDIVLHVRIASEATTDAVGFTVDSFFNEGDSKVTDTTGTNQTATYAEKTAAIAAADVPAEAQTISIGLTPVAHTTDKMFLTAAWLEYTRTIRTS